MTEKLNFSTKLAYGSGDLAAGITANILVFFLMYFFTQVAGLSPALAGTILMIGKVADAINDPIIGIWSDRTSTRWGRRLPWMLGGAIPFVLIFVLQWIVPTFSENEAINDWFLFSYYVFIGIIFNLAYTAVNLPYTALTPELTNDYNERTSLNSFRFAFSIGGSIFSLILARIVFSNYPDNLNLQYLILGLVGSIYSLVSIFWCVFRMQEKGAQPFLSYPQRHLLGLFLTAFGAIFVIYGVTAPLFRNTSSLVVILAVTLGLLITVAGVTFIFSSPEEHLISSSVKSDTDNSLPILNQLKIVFSNHAFLYVIGIYLCSWLSVQLTASILPYFVVSWLGLPNVVFPQVALMVQGNALVMLFVGSFLSKKYGKKAVYFMGSGLWIIAQGGLFFLQPGQVSMMYFLAFIAGFGVSVAYLIPWSMIPDVVDLDELNTGQRREGIFYGFMVLLQKFGLALGLFLVGQGLELSGFIEGQTDISQPNSALLAIRIAIGPLPTFFLILGLVLAYFYPITREIHGEILLKLNEKKVK
jgi:GPH family glycoside/pentoside/hexuronide:cation symporter